MYVNINFKLAMNDVYSKNKIMYILGGLMRLEFPIAIFYGQHVQSSSILGVARE